MEDLYLLIRRQDDPGFCVYSNEEMNMIISTAPRDFQKWFRPRRMSESYSCSTQTKFDQEINMKEAVFRSKTNASRVENFSAIRNLLRSSLRKLSKTSVSDSEKERNSIPSSYSLTITSHDATIQDLEKPTHTSRVFLGRIPGIISLWRSGSVLKWTARKDNWCTSSDGVAALRACMWAVRKWNSALRGRLTFMYVERCDEACWILEGHRTNNGLLAKAFSPINHAQEMNQLLLYDSSFSDQNLPFLRGILLHEIGHIIGLRHEDAHTSEDSARGPESISWGLRNTRSVMGTSNYRFQKLSHSDKISVRKAYDRLDDGMTLTGKTRTGFFHKNVRRVSPNN